MDPVITSCCCCLKKTCGSHQRNKILEKAEEKINDELEITSLLHKLRNSYDSIKQYQSKSKMMDLKLNKERVIDIESEEEGEAEAETEIAPE